MVLRNSCVLAIGCAAAFAIVFELFPWQVFHFYGIHSPTAEQVTILRIFCAFFLFDGFNQPVRTYFTSTKQVWAAARVTSLNGSPVFIPALLFLNVAFGGIAIWWAYTVCAVAAAIGGAVLLKQSFRKEQQETAGSAEEVMLYLSLHPRDGVTVSSQTEAFVLERTGNGKLAVHMGITVEELTMDIREKSPDANIDILLRRVGDKMILSMFDDGAPIRYTGEIRKGENLDRLQMARLMADHFSYRNTLGLNYMIAEFLLLNK